MPRDANGNYLLPAENPVTSGTTIESNWANTTMQDLAAEMTDSLSRSGNGGIQGPFQIIDELTGVPGLAFTNEPTSGLKRSGAGDVRMQVQSTDVMRFRNGTNRCQLWGGSAFEDIASRESLAIPAANNAMSGVNAQTKVWFYSAIPAGWAPAPPDANIRSLVAGTTVQIAGSLDPVNTPVSTAVTVALSGTTDGHGLDATENGPHTHAYTDATSGPSSPASGIGAGNVRTSVSTNATQTVSSGSGTPHTHGLSGNQTGTGTDTLTPRYAEGLIGVMDAP